MVFWRKKNSVCKFDGKQILSRTWAEKNILLALCALINTVFAGKKNNVAKTNSAALQSKQIQFDSEKNHSPPLQVKWMFP